MHRKQHGQICAIGEKWFVRFWERRNIGGQLQRKRASTFLGPKNGRGKRPPQEIVEAAEKVMAAIKTSTVPAEQILTMTDFAEGVFLPWVERSLRPSTSKGYRQVWMQHLKPYCGKTWLKDTRCCHAQNWLNLIARDCILSKNSLLRIQSILSALFRVVKQQGYYESVNPVQDTRVDPSAPEAAETYAYSLEEVLRLLAVLPEPAATAFGVAAFAGLRIGEVEGLMWEDYRNCELHVSRAIWNGRIGKPKTTTSKAPVPVIRQLADRLEMHRQRSGNPQTGPIFRNVLGKPMSMNNLTKRTILPALNVCASCGKSKGKPHLKADHDYQRDPRLPLWHGFHSNRRGIGSNLHRLGVPDKVIQRILRHANVSTTTGYYIKTTDADARNAMSKLEENLLEIDGSKPSGHFGTLKPTPESSPESIN